MSKFVIDSVLIEKSSKDIKENEKYNFSEGLNLITGNNEAGKSSLMSFIKEGLFKEKGVDTGKIFFKYEDKYYRADIKDDRTLNKRCKIYNADNNLCSDDFLNGLINEPYFKEGFYISLDDLMKIQTKDTASLVNVIKDPSSDIVKERIKELDNEINDFIGKDNKPKKELKEILALAEEKNSQIIKLNQKETEYYKNIKDIQLLDEELTIIDKEEEFLKLVTEIQQLELNKKNLTEEKQNLILNFNQKLFYNQKSFIEIFENSGKYYSNLDLTEKNKQKIEEINKKINSYKEHLNLIYPVNLEDKEILSVDLPYNKIAQIKENIENIKNIDADIKYNLKEQENLENNLKKLNQETQIQLDIKEIKNLHDKTEEGLKQYYFLSSQLNAADNKSLQTQTNITVKIIFILLFVITIIFAFICYNQKLYIPCCLGITAALISFAGIFISKVKKADEEYKRKKQYAQDILQDLKENVKIYFPEIDASEASYLPSKLENIKEKLSDMISNALEKNNILSRLDNVKNKYNELKTKSENLNKEIKSLIDSKFEGITPKDYINSVEIITALKKEITDKNQIEQELATAQNNNNQIFEYIKKFLLDTEVNIEFNQDLKEILNGLNKKSDKNNEIKKELDKLDIELTNVNKNICELEEKRKTLTQYFENKEITVSYETLTEEKEEKQKLKKEAEFNKRELEKFEGISDLKLEKSILLDDYRKKIKKLFADKIILELVGMAKKEVDKTQPDLINAQKYLSILTENKYTKINLEFEEIYDEQEKVIKKWENLSRGTKEQLYFALKLGYASNYSKNKTTLSPNGKPDLPLIIDDAFVNFDKERTQKALLCLIEFSKTNQVLYFTCHSEQIKSLLEDYEYRQINM